jgi:chromosome transmission fidelity protein 4
MAEEALAFVAAHPAGLCDVDFLDLGGGECALVTCGADGLLAYRPADGPDLAAAAHAVAAGAGEAGGAPAALAALAATPRGDGPPRVAVACEGNFVKVWAGAGAAGGPAPALDAVATRFTLPPRALAYSPSGATLAAAGDDDGLKLVDCATNRVFRTIPAQARGLFGGGCFEGIFLFGV